MNRKLVFGVITAAAVGAGAASLVIPAGAAAPSSGTPPTQNVFVTNPLANPVPVLEVGTPNVNVTNSALSVNVGNTPAVKVDANSSDRVPYQHTIFFNESPQTCTQFVCSVSFPVVPAGKRLVITYASAHYGLSPNGTLANVQLGVNGNGIDEPQIALPAPVRIGFDTYVASAPVTFYAEAGQTPTLELGGQFVQPASLTADASIVGYLVPAS